MIFPCSIRNVPHVLTGIAVGMALMSVCGCEAFNAETRRQTRSQKVVSLTEQGGAAKDAGNYQSALDFFDAALAIDNRHVPAHLGKGEVYQAMGDYEQAAVNFERARDLSPTNFNANYKLALMQQLINRLRRSVDNYLNALAIDPDNFEANTNLATAYVQLGQPRLAVNYAERAVETQPQSFHAHLNLASVYVSLGRDEQAIDAYRAAADRGELDPRASIGLADALTRTGKYDRAVNTLQAVQRAYPEHALVNERLGYTFFKMSDFDRSRQAYLDALKADPDLPRALNGLGVSQMALYIRGGQRDSGLRDRAIQAWQRSVRINPTQPRIVDLISRYRSL